MLTLIKRTGGIDTSDATAGPYQILTGYSGYVDDDRIEGTMPNRGKYIYSLPVNTSHNIPDGWHNGTGKIIQNLATQDTIVVTPGTSPKLVCAADRWTIGDLWVKGDGDLVAGNIKDKVTLFGVTGTYRGCVTTDATVGAAQILTGYSAYGSAGTKIAGTMPNNGTTNHSLDLNGSFTIPAGWHNGNGKVTQSLTTQAGWTATPGTGNILLCSAERWTTGDIWVKGDGNLAAGNIKKGVTIFGVTGTYDKYGSGNSLILANDNFDATGEFPATWISENPAGSGMWREGCWCYFYSTSNATRLGWEFNLSVLSGKSWTLWFNCLPLLKQSGDVVSDAWAKRFYIWIMCHSGGDSSIGRSVYNRFGWWASGSTISAKKGYRVHFGPDNAYHQKFYAGRVWITID